MSDPDPHTPPTAPTPQGPAPSIWRTLDGRPIPRRTPAGAGFAPGGPPLPTFRHRGQDPTPGGRPAAPAAWAPTAVAEPAAAPGAPAQRFVLATWRSRAAAYLIDVILLGLATLCVTVPLCLAGGMTVQEAFLFLGLQQLPNSIANPGPMYAVLVLQLLAPAIIAATMLARWNGQTLGKQALRIRVVRAGGEPMTMQIAVRREVLARTLLLSLLAVPTFGIASVVNYLWPLWDRESRAGEDFVAGTRVIQVPPDPQD